MKTVRITRISTDPNEGTFGALTIDGFPFCVTLEPADLDNNPNVSCVPASQYRVLPHRSRKFGSTYELWHVPNRTGILFHAGNTMKDTAGCIILGEHFSKLLGVRAVLNSGKTFKNFKKHFDRSGFMLTIVEAY